MTGHFACLSRLLLPAHAALQVRRLLHRWPLDAASIRRMQTNKLRRLLTFAYDQHAFYREMMDAAGLDPRRLREVEELQRLPIVTKEMFRSFSEEAVQRYPGWFRDCYRTTTSGSTGIPLQIYRTWNEQAHLLAKFMRVLFLHGYSMRDRMLWIASPEMQGPASFMQKLGLGRRDVLSFALPAARLVEACMQRKPDIIYANKSHLVQMALHVMERGIALPAPKLCVSVGETLDAVSRGVIESAFGSNRLLDVYGSLEFSTLAFRSPGRDFYWFNHDMNVLELTDTDAANPDSGTCVITDLHQYALPLIRYALGDRMELGRQDGVPIIRSIAGRKDDVIVLPDGSTRAAPMIEVIMEAKPAILQYRVVQESMDFVRVMLVVRKDTDTTRLQSDLTTDLLNRLSPDLRYEIEFLPVLLPEKNGKLRLLISKVKQPAG